MEGETGEDGREEKGRERELGLVYNIQFFFEIEKRLKIHI